MEKLLYLFAFTRSSLERKKPKHLGFWSWIAGKLADLIIIGMVWLCWMVTLPFREWSYTRTTIAELKPDPDAPYATGELIKMLKHKYPGAVQIKVYRYPHYRVGYNAWTFRVHAGVNTNKVESYNIVC